jgi:hypothetical protein
MSTPRKTMQHDAPLTLDETQAGVHRAAHDLRRTLRTINPTPRDALIMLLIATVDALDEHPELAGCVRNACLDVLEQVPGMVVKEPLQ